MRTALFGGSFNPPHAAHQMVCLYVLETSDVDRVLWVPVGQHPFAKDLEAFEHRYEMCRLAAEPFGSRAEVSRIEQELPTPSRTLVTLRHLRARFPEDRFSLVIGSDILPERSLWYGWDEIERMCEIVVVGRGGHAGSGGAGDPASGAVTLPAVSSTEVRARLRRGEDVSALVPRRVLEYIRRHGLYVAGGEGTGGSGREGERGAHGGGGRDE